MAYTIYKSDGTPVNISDNVISTQFYDPLANGVGKGLGIQQVGRNSINYGAAIAQNILQITENFAGSVRPDDSIALQGQLWFNKVSSSTGNLYVRTSSATTGGLENWKMLVTADPDSGEINNRGGRSAVVEPVNPLDGDIKVIGTEISIYADNAWRNIVEPDMFVSRYGDTMSGFLTLSGNPVNALHAATKQYVDVGFLKLSGGTLTGALTLASNPINALHAATKQYVDDGFLKLSGGTLTGALTLASNPTANLHAATKQYVDVGFYSKSGGQISGSMSISGTLTLSGNPTSNLHAATKQYVDAQGVSNHVSAINPHPQYVFPAGFVQTFYGLTAPPGWVVADGSLLTRSAYPELWAHVFSLEGTGCLITDAEWADGDISVRVAWSTGDGTTSFRLPDLRGMFGRYWDKGRGVDEDRELGTYQPDAVGTHKHNGVLRKSQQPAGSLIDFNRDTGTDDEYATGDNSSSLTDENIANTENRPKNISLLACISTGKLG